MTIEWDLLHQIARSYLDIQKTRVGMDLRSQRMMEQHMIHEGLAYEVYTNVDEEEENEDEDIEITEEHLEEDNNNENNYDNEVEAALRLENAAIRAEKKKGRGRKVKYIESKDPQKQKEIDARIKEEKTDFSENSEAYKLIVSHKYRLFKQEKDLLRESVKLFNVSNLWKWCLSVKGLGDVAGMTFIGYIDPTKIGNKLTGETVTIYQLYKYLGLSPDSKLQKGKQAKFNPLLKGRFLGVIGQNVIRSADPFYSQIYRIKKEYYAQRPDLIAAYEKKHKGHKAHIHKMALRLLTKLIVSHAFDILKYDRGLTDEIIIDHRNNIPLKPSNLIEQQKILNNYRYNHTRFLEKLKIAWNNDTSENKEKYYEYLRHGEINFRTGDDLGL